MQDSKTVRNLDKDDLRAFCTRRVEPKYSLQGTRCKIHADAKSGCLWEVRVDKDKPSTTIYSTAHNYIVPNYKMSCTANRNTKRVRYSLYSDQYKLTNHSQSFLTVNGYRVVSLGRSLVSLEVYHFMLQHTIFTVHKRLGALYTLLQSRFLEQVRSKVGSSIYANLQYERKDLLAAVREEAISPYLLKEVFDDIYYNVVFPLVGMLTFLYHFYMIFISFIYHFLYHI